MIKVEQELGLAGEFQVIVRRPDGSVKLDTGMQPNLILDNGIKHYLRVPMVNNSGKQQDKAHNGFMNNCYVGTGNKPPAHSDFALQNFVSRNKSSTEWTFGQEEPAQGLHEGFVKLWKRGKYIFDDINNKNITEVGLVVWFGDETIGGQRYQNAYTLVTRALIKDGSGSPISVTVLPGEVLEVIYQINMYIDIKRQTGTFTVTTSKDGNDTVDTFEYFLQPYGLGSANYIYGGLSYHVNTHGATTWGVKETDAELTAAYDLNAPNYAALTHLDITKLNSMVTTEKTSIGGRQSRYDEDYMQSEEIERSYDLRRVSYKNTCGIYTHLHPNGIRAYRISVGYGEWQTIVSGLVVIKNRANGQGIKKTNRQLWEFTHSFTINRWNG